MTRVRGREPKVGQMTQSDRVEGVEERATKRTPLRARRMGLAIARQASSQSADGQYQRGGVGAEGRRGSGAQRAASYRLAMQHTQHAAHQPTTMDSWDSASVGKRCSS